MPEAEEPHCTFVENALAKARHAATLPACPRSPTIPASACDALRGAPGVYSARYAQLAGGEKSDAANNAQLVAELCRATTDRRAHYYCVLVLVRHADDPEPLIAEGRWHGEIARLRRAASNGFGYDPYFFLPALNASAAELEPARKERASAIARWRCAQLLARLKELRDEPAPPSRQWS